MPRIAPVLALALVLLVPSLADARRLATNAEGEIATYHYHHFIFTEPAHVLARLDGELDPVASFGRNGFVQDQSSESPHVEIDDEGRILQAWNGASEGGPAMLRRRLADGRPDVSFGSRGVRAIDLGPRRLRIGDMLQVGPDRILLSGGVTPAGGEQQPAVVALHADGTVDAGFGDAGVAYAPRPEVFEVWSFREVSTLPDGRILASWAGLTARFEPDGALDPSFGTGGVMTLDAEWDVAASGTGVILARGLGGDGVEVQRRLEDGTPDPDWGDGGGTVAPLDAHENEDGSSGDEVDYFVQAVLARPDGGAVLATERIENYGSGEETIAGVPVLFDAEGTLVRAGDRGNQLHSLEPLPGGGFAGFAAHSYDECQCEPGDGILAYATTYDAAGARLNAYQIDPRRIRPDVGIASGPPAAPGTVTGPSASFGFTVRPAAPEEDTALECSIGDGPQGPCPADGVFRDLPEGPAILRVVALGVHGASSEERTWNWTVNHRAPATTITRAPSGTTAETGARIEFTADEESTFSCRLDGREPVACDGGVLEVSGLALGEHRVTVQAKDRYGAVEPAPPSVSWTVVAPPVQPQTPAVPQPIAPRPPPTGQTGPRVKVLVIGKVRKGRVRVRFLPFDTGQVELRASVVTRARSRSAGTRLFRTRGGRPRTVTIRLSARGRRILRRAASRGQRPRIAIRAVMIEG